MKFHLLTGLFLCILFKATHPAGAEEPVAASITIPAAHFNAKSTGAAEQSAWNLSQNGQIDCVINFPVSNAFTFIIVARGEPVGGVWPLLRVTLDGRTLFQTGVDSPQWIPYTFNETVSAGLHEMAVAFVNDDYKPPEDRNLHISDLTITAPSADGIPVQLTEKEYRRWHEIKLKQWTQETEKEIERLRKGKLVVWATDTNDAPLIQAVVKITQTRHEFLFGTALCTSMFEEAEPSAEALLYREQVKRLFNHAVTENALKWIDMEPAQNQLNVGALDRMTDWCASNRIPLRGHCLFWGCHYPEWIQSLSNDVVEKCMETRAVAVASRYSRDIGEFDVLNEPLHCPYFSKRFGEGIVKNMFEWTRESNPMSTLYVNEYNILNEGEADAYADFIRTQLKAGAGITGIGVQGHFSGEADPFRIRRALDALAAFERPIKVTEFDCDSTNEATRIQCLQTVYRAAFAHPAVKGILMWGFWEKCHWRPHAALLREDFSNTKLADAYEKLVFKDWWTRAEGQTDPVGRYEGQAFFGEYDVEISYPGFKTCRTNAFLSCKEVAAILTVQLKPGGSRDAAPQEDNPENYNQPVGR
ncbi:MAG: hypothetical protein A2X46_02835 [Lentisphaerae bacterium GWF2_57_35]|nr:MAG: hypothetical protein A2X46_02835 [Lentisphaerae bacterium GWF2_57_35]